jgi:glycosyltransferase involved in cell wall biosynthesis
LYNGATTIERTLSSICAQTYTDLDIVVVNDGSTDQSERIVNLWRDPRVRLVSKLNAGLSAARNSGSAATQAPFLAFCDADDIWSPRKLEAQMETLSNHPDALVWCWYDEIDANGNVTRLGEMSSEESLESLCRWNFIGNGSSMLVSRRVFEISGGFDTTLKAAEDYSFALQVADKYPVKVVRERLLSYRVTSTNMSSNTRNLYNNLIIVLNRFAAKRPEYKADLDIHRRVAALAYYYRSLDLRDYTAARFFYYELWQQGALCSGLKRNFARSWLKNTFIKK